MGIFNNFLILEPEHSEPVWLWTGCEISNWNFWMFLHTRNHTAGHWVAPSCLVSDTVMSRERVDRPPVCAIQQEAAAGENIVLPQINRSKEGEEGSGFFFFLSPSSSFPGCVLTVASRAHDGSTWLREKKNPQSCFLKLCESGRMFWRINSEITFTKKKRNCLLKFRPGAQLYSVDE